MEKSIKDVEIKNPKDSKENYVLEIACVMEDGDKYDGPCTFYDPETGNELEENKKNNILSFFSRQNLKIFYLDKNENLVYTYIGTVDKDLKPDGLGKIKEEKDTEKKVHKIVFEHGKKLIELGYEEGGKEYEMYPNVSIMEKDGKFDWYGCHDSQLSSTEFEKDNFLEWFGGGEHISISYRNKNGSWKETYIGSIDGDLKPHGIGMQKYPNKDVVVGEFVHGVRKRIILFNGKKVESIVTPGGNNNDKKVEKEIMRSSNSKTSEFDLQKGISKSYMTSKK